VGALIKSFQTAIPGLFFAETTVRLDERGSFARLFCQDELSTLLESRQVVQINHSCTASVGAIRGLHFQYPPHAEMKFVRCLKGRVWDVAVDIRESSPTFLQWHAEELSPANGRMMIIPEGFAHGFQALESNAELLYLHTAFYEPTTEGGLMYDDPRLAIAWPVAVADLSSRDSAHPYLESAWSGVKL
jgi:dTDP-4-dehydrorhamnose 3,5-epimerase